MAFEPSLPPKIGDFCEIIKTVKEIWNLDILEYEHMPSLDDANFRIRIKSKNELNAPEILTLKIGNKIYNEQKDVIKCAVHAMRYMNANGVTCPKPIGNEVHFKKFSFGEHYIRIQTYIYGTPFSKIKECVDGRLYFEIGKKLAEMHKILAYINEDEVSPLKTRDLGFWDLRNLPKLKYDNSDVFDSFKKEAFEIVISDFEQKVIAHLNDLPEQLIHGDFNDENIVIEIAENDVKVAKNGFKDSENKNKMFPMIKGVLDFGDRIEKLPMFKIAGVLDFGDVHYSKRVFDVAICIAYMSLHGLGCGVLEIGGQIIAGYLEKNNLSDLEISLLKYCIQGRYVISLIAGGQITPQNLVWEALKVYSEVENELLIKNWISVNDE